ncbi:MAG: acetate kinase [Chloroherpetonaceae bacterium]|nr:acetate kinase [Chloroherpetonaceae bacterium]
MNILVLNCGSSSVKFQVIQTDLDMINQNSDRALASGVVERIGSESLITFRVHLSSGVKNFRTAEPLKDHHAAIKRIIQWVCHPSSGIEGISSTADIHAVGHRVVHGGEKLTTSILLDEHTIRQIEDCIELAPLHNPQNLKGIYATREVFGINIPNVAVFDTAFHHTLPDFAYLYAIPYQLYRRHKVRRYGFHGISHRYISFRYRTIVGMERNNVNIISIHLGNGCSSCAIKGGVSVDTSMGMTPLEGLIMGTRAGDVDLSAMHHIAHKEGYTTDEIETILNKQSGLLGISGLTNDMRELIDEAKENDDRRAKLAVEMFCYRIRKYIGSYLAALGGAQAIIFTGGIGENSPYIREKICKELQWFGLELSPELNDTLKGGKEGRFTSESSKLAAYVIPTNEELIIARDTYRTIHSVI